MVATSLKQQKTRMVSEGGSAPGHHYIAPGPSWQLALLLSVLARGLVATSRAAGQPRAVKTNRTRDLLP